MRYKIKSISTRIYFSNNNNNISTKRAILVQGLIGGSGKKGFLMMIWLQTKIFIRGALSKWDEEESSCIFFLDWVIIGN